MLLAIDVGNTNIVLGVFDGTAARAQLAAADAARADVRRARAARRRPVRPRAASTASSVTGIVLGSVVPPLTGTDAGDGRALLRPRSRSSSIRRAIPGMPILYENPAEVGADRIVNAIAAYEQFGREARRPLDRLRLRHGDDARCGDGEGRVPGRRDLPGRDDLGRRAVPAGGAAAANRRPQAGHA